MQRVVKEAYRKKVGFGGLVETSVVVSGDDFGVHLYLNMFYHLMYYYCGSFAYSIVLSYCLEICIVVLLGFRVSM